jgi:hypothetical protein
MLTYEQFKAKLEDQCIYAINVLGRKIQQCRSSHEKNHCCPLGTKGTNRYPYIGLHIATAWDISLPNTALFINGFEGALPVILYGECDMRFYKLGKLYREKYVIV